MLEVERRKYIIYGSIQINFLMYLMSVVVGANSESEVHVSTGTMWLHWIV